MGRRLPAYVETRIHEWIDSKEVERIDVIGSYNRAYRVSAREKRDKLENWQRPTATVTSDVLTIHCYPGRAYVFHVASLVATRLALTGRDPGIVRMAVPDPARTGAAIREMDLQQIPVTSSVVVATSNLLLAPTDAPWHDGGRFLHRQELDGVASTWLAIKHSFWGDIAFHLGRELVALGFQRVVFVGKLGSLVPGHTPNTTLASGATSSIDGEMLEWDNLFEDFEGVEFGHHVTLPSVLQETLAWRRDVQPVGTAFVDPEIGHFAAGVTSAGGHFSYLHIVSDNLRIEYPEDLTTERQEDVLVKRQESFRRAADMLRSVLNRA